MSKTPHIHAAVIHAYADGAEIEWRDEGESHWHQCLTPPQFRPEVQYRVKPEPPVRVYPESKMDTQGMVFMYEQTRASYSSMSGAKHAALHAVACAALRHAIDHFQVVPTDIVEKLSRRLAKAEAELARALDPKLRLVQFAIDKDAETIFKAALAGEV